MDNLKLVIPQIKDLWFKKEIKEDPNTMDYNAGYDLTFSGYNRESGTIKTDLKELETIWFKNWVGNEPNKFYYFIKLNTLVPLNVYEMGKHTVVKPGAELFVIFEKDVILK